MSQLGFKFDGSSLRKIGLRAIEMIEENVGKGIDIEGKKFEPYSTNPFSMPLGAFFANTTKKQRETLANEGDLQIFRSKSSGKRWIRIDGGYANFKNARFPQDGGAVNLQVRGSRGRGMMSQIAVLKTEPSSGGESSIVIGFLSSEAAQLATYHHVTGAGKSKTLRRFFGITPSQEIALAEYAEKLLLPPGGS